MKRTFAIGLAALAVLFLPACAAEIAAVGSAITAGERVYARTEDVAGKLHEIVLKVRHLRERACNGDGAAMAWARRRIVEQAEQDGVNPDQLREKLCSR